MPLVSLDDVVNRKFDYIIVGGGTAGLVLAARLTEDDNTTVLVLEAGPANLDDDLILRPAQFGAHFGRTEYDWNFATEGTEVVWHLGRGLGGGSATNYLCWTKPPAEDIDDFERLGNPGWNWKNHEKYLDKVENFIHVSPDVQAARGLDLKEWKCSQEGLLKIAHTGSILDIELKAHKALNHLGIPKAKAPLHGDPNGTFLIPGNIDPATFIRTYSTNAYYLPNADRTNLSVLVLAHANKILFEESTDVNGGLVASGVEFAYGTGVFVVNSAKEVILAATTVKSPQILELSGIGRRDVLERIDVPVKVDLPGVGENLQEHVNACVSFEIQDNVQADTWDILQDSSQLARHIALYATGSGLFTTGISAVAFAPLDLLTDKAEEMKNAMRTKVLQNADTYPPGLLEQHKIMLERFDRRLPGCEIITIPKFLSRPNLPAPGKRYITFAAATNYNFSRGSVHCATSDPQVDPMVDPRYFEEEIDILTIVEMVKFVRKLSTVHPFSEVVGDSPTEINPGPQVQTDEQISAWIKQALNSTFHPAGTCSMLPREKGGVVDPQLKVYGTKNVRVVDLSIVPLHFASHSQATVYAIAEQAADIIRERLRL